MRKYEQLSEQIIEKVGGKDNVVGLTHCVTRLRFTLKDEGIAKEKDLKNMDGVVTVVKSGGQFQVVIGNHVPDVYKEVSSKLGLSEDSSVSKANMSFKDKAFAFISGVMLPSMAVMTASGIIQGLTTILMATGVISMDSSIYVLMDAIGKGLFFFFPIFIGYNTAKVVKLNPYLGMAIGAILCMPAINSVDMNFFGWAMNVKYTETVFPAILIVCFAAPLERFFNRVIPDVVKTFITPALVLLISIPVGYILIGPVINWLSLQVSAMITGLINLNPTIAGFVSGGLWQVFVMFGVHMAVVMPSVTNLVSGIPDQFLAFVGPVSFAQTAVVIAIWLKTKDRKLKDIALPAWISGIFGVTEPAIYGVTLPRLKYFIISCIAAGIGSAYVGFTGTYMYQMAGMGIFSLPGTINPNGDMSAFINMLIGIGIASALAFIATFVMYKDDAVEEAITDKDLGNSVPSPKKKEVIVSPIEGNIIELENVQDAAFAMGAIGRGIAINPMKGEVVAPFDGTVMALFPTKHAIGLISDDGVELLIHIGLDTVKLEGKHFQEHVKQGDKFKKGQLLVSFDIDAIKSEGYILETPVIVTNVNDYLDIIPEDCGKANNNDVVITVVNK